MNKGRLLLHICCAPDATVPWPELAEEGWEVAGFVYGGNIHPEEEYLKRSEAALKLSRELEMPVEISRFSEGDWLGVVAGLEGEPEGGKRCEKCFALQLEAAALSAREKGFTHLCTTLTISPHKNPELINAIGREAAEKNGLQWVDKVWRRADGFKRSVAESKRLRLYRQNYCGCKFSLAAKTKNESERGLNNDAE